MVFAYGLTLVGQGIALEKNSVKPASKTLYTSSQSILERQYILLAKLSSNLDAKHSFIRNINKGIYGRKSNSTLLSTQTSNKYR